VDASPLRVVIAEDSALIREGIARLIQESGGTVVAKVGDGPSFIEAVVEHHPDVSGVDAPNLDWVEMPQIGISSSLIRERVRDGRPIRYFVPDAVRELIEAEGLYRDEFTEPVDPS